MNELEIVDSIKGDLGFPIVKVEISDEQWTNLIKRAKRWFNARKGLIGCAWFTSTSGQNPYDIPLDSYNVIDVVTPGRGGGYSDLLGWCGITDLIPIGQLGGTVGLGQFTTNYLQIMQTLDSRAKAFGFDKSWYESCGKLYLNGNSTGPALIFYKRKTWEVNELVGRDEDMFYRYCLALAKEVVGRIRMKYSNYPTAGGTITMDGDVLMNESRTDIEALNEEIFGSQGNSGGIVKG